MAHVTPEPNVRNVPELLVELEAKTRSFISQLAQRRTFWLRRIGEMTDDSLGQWVRQGNLAEVESIIEQAGDLRSLLDELDKAKVAMGMPLGSELAKKRGPR